MSKGSFRLALCLAAAGAACVACLALPGFASAFQTVSIDVAFDGSKTIHIVGDQGKTRDLVTVSYDPTTNEYVITHDINMTSPPAGCHFVGSGPPYKELRCPASLVTDIEIDVGEDSDSVVIDDLLSPVLPGVYLAPELNEIHVNLGPGNDSFSAAPWMAAPYPRFATASATGHPALNDINTGPGVDKATIEGGTNTVVFGGSGKFIGGDGNNTITTGKGNSNITVGNGTNNITVGAGDSKVTVGDGTDTARFGAGDSTFIAGGGTDVAKFGAGDNHFSGGAGNDKAKLGAGNDTASGGPGKDKLIGGAGTDKLFGNAGFDVLKGGGGHADKCAPGGGGAKTVGCEKR